MKPLGIIKDKYKGSELAFISQINRDGSGTTPVSDGYLELLANEVLKVFCLSMSEDTYIAHGVNVFVVRIKNV